MKPAWMILSVSLFLSIVAHAEVHSCSEPPQNCSSTDGSNVYMDPCSITCPDGINAICVPGDLIESTGTPSCYIQSENQCYCSGDDRKVERLGDHE